MELPTGRVTGTLKPSMDTKQFQRTIAELCQVPPDRLFGCSATTEDVQAYMDYVAKTHEPFRHASACIKNLLVGFWFYKSGKRRVRRPKFARCA